MAGCPPRAVTLQARWSRRSIVGQMEHVLGSASIRRIGALTFPTFLFVAENGTSEETVLARLGRDGWFRVFFGRGRRVELSDGTPWRVTAVGVGPHIEPRVMGQGGKLAVAASNGNRSYAINGRDYAYNFYPTSRKVVRKPAWLLREHDTELATFKSHSMHAEHPIPMAAALLCFTLLKYGIPGEASLGIPKFHWA